MGKWLLLSRALHSVLHSQPHESKLLGRNKVSNRADENNRTHPLRRRLRSNWPIAVEQASTSRLTFKVSEWNSSPASSWFETIHDAARRKTDWNIWSLYQYRIRFIKEITFNTHLNISSSKLIHNSNTIGDKYLDTLQPIDKIYRVNELRGKNVTSYKWRLK
jgi:hypothetical protein